MDEQDERWLEAHNALRKEDQADPIKPAIFEISMTQIEREYYALEKSKLPSDEATVDLSMLTITQEYQNQSHDIRMRHDQDQAQQRP